MIQVKSRYEDTKNGYIKLYLSDGRVTEEHRFKMEQKLGRRLQYNEVVHHKNGNKHDNRLVNLELKSRSLHASSHCRPLIMCDVTCFCCGRVFERAKYKVDFNLRRGQKEFFCGRVCMGKVTGWKRRKR